jgi:hypothetical protein
MAVKDLSQSAGILFDERRDFYLPDSYTKELWTEVTPFITMVSNLGYDKVTDPDFKMFEHRAGFIRQQMTVASDGGSTWSDTGTGAPGATTTVTIVPGSSKGLPTDAAGDYLVGLVVEAYASDDSFLGVARIQSVSSNDITLVAQGNPQAADNNCDPFANSCVFEVIGNAIGEGEVSPEAFSDDLEIVYNSTQIMRTPVEVTGTLREAALRGYTDELARLRTQKSYEHKIQKERTMLLGVRVGGTGMGASDNFASIQNNANGRKIRQTMGAISTILKYGSSNTSDADQNIHSFAEATADFTDIMTATEKLSQYLPSRGRFQIYASRQWVSFLSAKFLANNNSAGFQIFNNEKNSFGYNMSLLVTPHAELEIYPTPVLRDRYSNYAFIANPDAVSLKKYREMRYSTNIKTENGYDGVKDEFFSDEGLCLQLQETHHVWKLT